MAAIVVSRPEASVSALFLLMLPPIALAAFRALAGHGVRRDLALALSVVVALALTAVPAYLLRTKPSRGAPAATPNAPAFGGKGADARRVALQVEFGAGWEPQTADEDGRAIRRMRGRAELVVGPHGPGRPPSTLRFEAVSAPPTRLTARFEERILATEDLGAGRTAFRFDVPPGGGPAVLELAAEDAAAVVSVFVATARALARPGG